MTESIRGQRPAAPEPLRLVQDFVNTTWLRTGEDVLTSPAALGEWLATRGLLPAPGEVSRADLALAIEVRTTLRELVAREPGRSPARPLAALSLRPEIDEHGRLGWMPSGEGVTAALTRILIAAWEGDRSGRWERLKLCAAPDCRWVFYDPSRNRSATWCNMAVCGARAKSRAYYHRRRAADHPAAG